MANHEMNNAEIATSPTPQGQSKSSKAETLRSLLLLAEAFGRELSSEAQVLMTDALSDVPLADLRRACGAALRGCRFMPTVAEILELAGMRQVTGKEQEEAEAHAAWDFTCAWLSRWAWKLRHPATGFLGDSGAGVPELDERMAGALRRAGGINRLYLAMGGDTDDLQWVRKSFLEEYRMAPAIQTARSTMDAAPQLGHAVTRLLESTKMPNAVATLPVASAYTDNRALGTADVPQSNLARFSGGAR